MRLFVVIMGGFSALNALLIAMRLMFKDYPRVEKFSLGEDAARLVEAVVIAMIAAYVLWG